MKILLVGEIYSENLGDAVICETVKRLIQQKVEAEIVDFDLSGRSDYNQYYSLRSLCKDKCHGYKGVIFSIILRKLFYGSSVALKRSLRVMMKLNEYLFCNKFDVVLFAGGALFQDYFAEDIFNIANRCKKKCPKIVFHACGLGKLSLHSKRLLKKVFSLDCVRHISVRDSYQKFISMFGNEHKVNDTFDTALCCSEFYKKSNIKIAEYGIGCINWENTYHIQKGIIQIIMNSGATWKIFTNGAPYDEEIVDRLLNDLGIHDKKNKLVLPRAMDAESLVNNITSFEKIISFRLHSHIIAASFGIPSYGFAWDSKVREFFSKLDAPQRCKELAEKIDYECLFEDVNKDLNDIEDIKKQADLSKKDLYRQLVGEMS